MESPSFFWYNLLERVVYMAKSKTIFICNSCGYESQKWLGRCTECGEWNTFTEEYIQPKKGQTVSVGSSERPVNIRDVVISSENRIKTRIDELDLVLGGGIVGGSLVLVGGDPGIGKSTLLLQMASNLSKEGLKILYISGEESNRQIKLRADRLEIKGENIFLMAETVFENIEAEIARDKPNILIVDSIQTVSKMELTSVQGSVSQVREVTGSLMKIAKSMEIATFIVGHVTKSGNIAGPKMLEHMVDTVLYFEGDKGSLFRILRSVKNRFGSTNEVGIFSMTSRGLEEMKNPSEIFIGNRDAKEPGTVVFPSMEGTRPLLVEIQGLVSSTAYPSPRRMGVGIDYNKLIMMTAILEKKRNIYMHGEDIYVNAVGGIQINEPAADLAILSCIASSYMGKRISGDTVVFGEVGLLGEVRNVPQVEKRLIEAKKMGFKRAVIPFGNNVNLDGIIVHKVKSIRDLFDVLFA